MAQRGAPPKATVRKAISPYLKVITLARPGLDELFITATPRNGGDFHRMFENVYRAVREAGATIVAKDVFGIPAAEKAGLEALHDVWGEVNWPVTWLDEGGSAGMALTGVQVLAVKGVEVERIRLQGRVVGSVFDDGFARHCCLGDLRASDIQSPREAQACQTFEFMETALRAAGMDFSNVVRTWLYVDGILSWYGELNAVRNRFFRERSVFTGVVPASTGVGGANAARAVLTADAYAIAPHKSAVRITSIPSPLQCPALEYGSSFSRAVEMDMPDHRYLWVSGTASIDLQGETAHVGDVGAQIDLTMRVVEAILESRRMGWDDVSRAVAYVKQGKMGTVFQKYCEEKGLQDLPVVTTENDICRDDLLFEIEVDALSTS
ncbi:MAG: RidA family protein [Planctomycetota bacterium]|nr:RidA family protein [Planctomycetota bacterium]